MAVDARLDLHGLTQEAHPIGRIGLASNHLEGDGALEGQVPSLDDHAHAAPAEYRLHLVAGNLRQAGGERRGDRFAADGRRFR